MDSIQNQDIINQYLATIENKAFPCVAAKAAMAKQQIQCMVAGHMACPKDDEAILDFLYSFVEVYRKSDELYHSAAVIFKGPEMHNEEMFDGLLWQRLQALANLDAQYYGYDKRVSSDPSSPDFSFSIKEEAFYVVGLHPLSSRHARQLSYPTLVFNPHAQFETLRGIHKYDPIKNVIRKRDTIYSGSVNPMMEDFGQSSEVYQYSGREYEGEWQCPLKITHADTQHHPAA